MPLRLVRTIARHGTPESGQTLVLTMIVMLALTISVFATVDYMLSNENAFGRDRQANRAFHISESGINDGLSLISGTDPNGTSTTTELHGSIAASLDTGTGTYDAYKFSVGDPNYTQNCVPPGGQSVNPCWVITANATSPDGRETRKLQETIYWNTQSLDESDVYGSGLFVNNGNPGDPCVKTHGGAHLDLTIDNVWIAGCVDTKGSAVIHPAADNTGFVFVGGDVVSGGIGEPGYAYQDATIVGTCGGGICSDSANSGVYAYNWPPPGQPLQKPDINAANVYMYGNPDGTSSDPTVDWSHPTCTGTHIVFDKPNADGTSTMNQNVGNQTLMPSSDFSCTVYDDATPTPNVIGKLSESGGVLHIEGTIFIDGNVDFSNSGSYTGDGTIYVNGTAGGASNIDVCGPADSSTGPLVSDHGCPHTWDPSLGKLGLVVINPNNSATGFDRNGQGEMDVDLFVNKGYADTGGTVIAGNIIADAADMGGSGGLVTTGGPPVGSPVTKTVTTGWTVSPGSWKQIH